MNPFVLIAVVLATAMFFLVRSRIAKVLLAIAVLAVIVWGFLGFKGLEVGTIAVPSVTTSVTAPYPCDVVCDPSTVPFTDMGELNPNVETVIVGPAIYEWWTGGSNEGVQRVETGVTVYIHGVKGHWWTLPSQAGLDCAWSLHVRNYGAKPQHAGKTIQQLIVAPPAEFIRFLVK